MNAAEARKAIESFFTAFNNRDGEAITKTFHFPHVRINGQGRMTMFMDEFDSRARWSDMAFRRLSEVEGWSHSSLDSVEVIHESDVKVHFQIEFSRYKEDGSKYVVHESLWMVTKREGEWGVIARSSYAP
jgi:hypothetical protein